MLHELLKMWRAHGEHWIIMKRADVPLWHTMDIVAPCVLYNPIFEQLARMHLIEGGLKKLQILQMWTKEKTLNEKQKLKSEKANVVEIRVKIHPK